MCDLDPKVKVIGKKAGICDGVPSTAALFFFFFFFFFGGGGVCPGAPEGSTVSSSGFKQGHGLKSHPTGWEMLRKLT